MKIRRCGTHKLLLAQFPHSGNLSMLNAFIILIYTTWTVFLAYTQELGAGHEPYRTSMQSGPNNNPLSCYTGIQNYESRPFIDNVTVQTCRPGDSCCYMMSSFGRTHYGCHNDCPDRLRTFLCGPDPDSNLQDIYYCYCKDNTDPNCQPTDIKRRKRSDQTLRFH